MLYNVSLSRQGEVVLAKVSFGEPGTNAEIVKEVSATLSGMEAYGKGLHIDGPASLPVAFVLAHWANHKFGYVAVFDPKLAGFVVAVSHDPAVAVGTVIPKE